jgi:hypothetical protein
MTSFPSVAATNLHVANPRTNMTGGHFIVAFIKSPVRSLTLLYWQAA